MTKLTILPSRTSVEVKEGESVKDALERTGHLAPTSCNNRKLCGHCRVWLQSPERYPATPHRLITPEQSRKGMRLSCRIHPEGDLSIRLTHDFLPEKEPSPAEDAAVRATDKASTRAGLSLDLGTTTLVASLVDLESGRRIAQASVLNPQIRYGQDAMTRIDMGSSREGLEELARSVRSGIRKLVMKLCRASSLEPEDIREAVIGGNTAMLQLCAEIDPAPLGQAPFEVDIKGGRSYPAGTFGIHMNPRGRVYVPPIIHAFVGSDISSGLIKCDGFFEDSTSTLFIDVGTNGEVGLSHKGRMVATSAAAGPAFEGMGISCGTLAVPGAIIDVRYEDGCFEYDTYKGAEPIGICASGIVSLTALLLEIGVIDHSGLMCRPEEANHLPVDLQTRLVELKPDLVAFRIAEGVHFSQDDVRQVQLAKSAIRTAIDQTLESQNVDRADKLVIAGAFGSNLDIESLERIGMIPSKRFKSVSFAGNTSRKGCEQLLRRSELRSRLESRMDRVDYLSLAESPEFMERYVANMEFPKAERMVPAESTRSSKTVGRVAPRVPRSR